MNRTYQAPLYLLPFDHRYCYVAGMFRFTPSLATEQHRAVVDGNQVIVDGFQRLGNEVKVNRAGTMIDEERDDAFAKHIEAFQPVFAKVQLRYNPEDDAALNKRQTKRLKELSDYCRAVGQPFMFDLLVPAMKAQSDCVRIEERVYDRRIRPHFTVEAVCVIKDAGVEPDSWKFEGFDSRDDAERVVTAVPGFVGFAVERTTFWDAVTDFMEARVTRAEAVSGIRGWVAVSERRTNAVTTPPRLVPRHITNASLPPGQVPSLPFHPARSGATTTQPRRARQLSLSVGG